MMSTRQVGDINQSLINDEKTPVSQCGCSSEIKIEAASTHRFPSESDAVEQCLVSSPKNQQIYVKRRSLSFVNIQF